MMIKKILRFTAIALTAGIMGGCSGNSPISSPEGPSSNVPSSADISSPESTDSATSVSENSTDSTVSDTEQSTSEPSVSLINTEPDYEWDKVIALTFDDGPNTTTTNEVLDILEKHQVIASFFLIGNNIDDESAKSVKRAYDLGCEINNHSRSHGNMDKMTAEEIEAEFDHVDEKVMEITGEHTKFFRPPYIAVGDLMWENIDVPFISGLGCNDWDDKVTAEMRVKAIMKNVKDGDIILMHDMQGNSKTVEAIDELIPMLKEQGYKFTTVSGLFEAKGIEPVTKIVYSNAAQQEMWG